MWYDQLSHKQKWQILFTGLMTGSVTVLVPLSLVFEFPIWPVALIEVASLILFARFSGTRPSVSDLPWITVSAILWSWFPVVRFFALAGIVRPKVYRKLWEQHQWLPQKLQVLAGGIILALVIHTIACGWLLIQPPTTTNPFDKYVFGVYWTVTTLATVGYGDIIPQSSLAKIYAMAIMLMGISSFAIFVSHFSRLLISRDSKLEAQKVKMKQLQEMLARYQIPVKLRQETYHLYQHILDHKGLDEEEKILGELPVTFREHLQVHMRVHSICRLEFFRGLSHGCLEMIARNFDERFYNSGEVIVRQGEAGHEMFVVHHGEVEIWRDAQKIGLLREGNVFGEMALLEETTRNAQVTAKKYCHMLILTTAAYVKISEEYPEFRTKLESVHRLRKSA